MPAGLERRPVSQAATIRRAWRRLRTSPTSLRVRAHPVWRSAIAVRDGYLWTAPVSRYKANAWGIFDMHGNVWEWCSDCYDASYYDRSPVDDPENLGPAQDRLIRGGGWNVNPRDARSANRARFGSVNRGNAVGFRLVRNAVDDMTSFQPVSTAVGESSREANTLKSDPRSIGQPATVLMGLWGVDGDDLVEVASGLEGNICFGDPSWSSYDMRFKALVEQGDWGFAFQVHYSIVNQCACALQIGLKDGNKTDILDNYFRGRFGRYEGMSRPSRFQAGVWYEVSLEVRGPCVRCYLGNEKLFGCNDDRLTKGRVGFWTAPGTAVRFRNILVATPEGRILWKGPPDKSPLPLATSGLGVRGS